jgi:transcriptional regulator with GAF, ATPase, and Fis domain
LNESFEQPRGHSEAAVEQDPQLTATSGKVARQLSTLARHLQGENDADALLTEIVTAAVDLIPGTGAGSISLVTNRSKIVSHAASSELASRVDALQEETGEGPCLDAAYQEQTVRVPDMGSEERWPHFASRAAEVGARSMLAFQLFVEGDNLGALNLYGKMPNAFGEQSEHIGLLFASHAAVALASVRQHDNLTRALDSRDLIGMAKGILMERYQIDSNTAFRVLVRSSQERQRKLHDIAGELVEHGTIGGERVTAGRRAAS